MCGLFGAIGEVGAVSERLERALFTLQHRGPDQWNSYADNSVYLGHTRLSINDLSENGKQPMRAENDDVVICVNGEVYNFLKLKEVLSKHYCFKGRSDSEVILYGYIEWGIERLVSEIDGMYAISIYDKRTSKVYLIRDRVGIKPLFYSDHGGYFLWGSELKAIKAFHEERSLSIDNTAVYDFLTYSYIPSPKTYYNEVRKLEAGHFLEFDIGMGKSTLRCYWKLKTDVKRVPKQEAARKVFELLTKSIDEQMVADVPIGFFLSGGMDSSVLVALAADSYGALNTFSIGFSDKGHDETSFAKIVAEKCATKHEMRELDLQYSTDLLKSYKEWFDEPFSDTSAIPTYLVSKIVREKCLVAISGDGGDELFGGYSWYPKFIKYNGYCKIKTKLFNKLLSAFKGVGGKLGSLATIVETRYVLSGVELYARLMGGLIKSEKKKYRDALNIEDTYDDYWLYRKYYDESLSDYKRLQVLDFHTFLPDDVLTKVDRVSMAVSLECRVPFLSKDLIEYCFSLDESVLVKEGELKALMKYTFKDILPNEIIDREKKGFSIPFAKWKERLTRQNTRQEMILEHFDVLVGETSK